MSTEAEDRLERTRAYNASYYERNKERLRLASVLNKHRPEAKARRLELYHLTRKAMIAQGLIEKRGRGRPRIYATKEEAVAARRSKAVGIRERWKELRAQLANPPARSDGVQQNV